MAISKETRSVALKVVSNYGEVAGKIVKKTRTYSDVKHEATNESLYTVFTHIKNLQAPIGESCMRVTTDELISAE